MSDDQVIIDTIAEKVARVTWGEGSGTAWDSLPRVARTGILAAAAAQKEEVMLVLLLITVFSCVGLMSAGMNQMGWGR